MELEERLLLDAVTDRVPPDAAFDQARILELPKVLRYRWLRESHLINNIHTDTTLSPEQILNYRDPCRMPKRLGDRRDEILLVAK
ncbi:MAG: hypothetical protein UZ17_ACD001001191 [Acidobacteria bacterium OLB17]|nr:MAG: hypothetical protein UZ17_ACD001001191 [Acidobacteria bacterium OLB17]